jgi:gibberellin A4 carboxyl methyltransferase
VKSGGKLLLEVCGAGDAGRTCDGIYNVLNDPVPEVLDDGMINRAAYDNYNRPVYFHTLDELAEPVDRYAPPFRIDRDLRGPAPLHEDFARSGNIEVHGREYTNFYRAFTEGALRINFANLSALDSLVSEIYTRAPGS